MGKLKPANRKSIESQKFLSTKLEIILRAAAKELEKNDDPMLNQGVEEERTSRKRRYSAESSDCAATQVEDLPGYSPDYKKRYRLNSNSFIYVEGNGSSSSSSDSEIILFEEVNIDRGLRKEEYEVCVSNNSFIENLAQSITKAMDTKCTPSKKPEEIEDSENVENNQQDQQLSHTGDVLDELIRNVLEDTDNDPTFHDVIADAVGELEFLFFSLKGCFFVIGVVG